MWKGTTYERFFKSGDANDVTGKLWEEVIKDTDNQVSGTPAGIRLMFEVNWKDKRIDKLGMVYDIRE